MERVLALDIGASSGRFIVFSFDDGKFETDEVYRFYNGQDFFEGHLRWNLEKLFICIKEGLKIALNKYKDIKSLGVDTWAVDYGRLNKDGNLIEQPIGYRDSRNFESMNKLLSVLPYSEIYKETGIQKLSFNTIFQLYDDVQNGRELSKILLIPDLINYMLTGEMRMELTNASTTALYNPVKKELSKTLLEKIGVDESIFAKLINPSEFVGYLKDEIVEELGIYRIPVVSVGSHDTASAVAGTVLVDNVAYLSSGTWSLLGVELEKPLINEDTLNANFTNEIGLEHRVRFLKNISGLFIIQELRKDFAKDKEVSFQQLQEEANLIKNNHFFIDVTHKLFNEPGDMVSKFYEYLKLTKQFTRKLSRGEIVRSVYESLVFKYVDEIKNLAKLTGKKIEKLCVVGGGNKATLLNQLIANALNIQVETGLGEATAFGNALAQFIYLKVFENLDVARAHLENNIKKEIYVPKDVAKYERKYRDYKSKIRGKSMKVLEAKFVKDFIRLCDEGRKKGWHERNGGNVSYRIKDEEIASIFDDLHDGVWQPIGTEVPELANEYFLVTGSGKYMMNVKLYPEDTLCIIKLDETGTKYKVVWGLVNGGKPTSELPSHLMNLEVVKKRTNGLYRIVYHCHATNIIALTFVLPLEDRVFTRELWEMATECPVVFPRGVGVVPWMVPGGKEIAIETSKLMKEYDLAVWAHHGIFGTGDTFDMVFGLVDTVEKSAEILVKVLSMTSQKRQTITSENFRQLAKDFKVDLKEEFLD